MRDEDLLGDPEIVTDDELGEELDPVTGLPIKPKPVADNDDEEEEDEEKDEEGEKEEVDGM